MKKIILVLTFFTLFLTLNSQVDSISRKIYIDHSGSDISGTGSIDNPFASLIAASQSIQSNVIAYIELIVGPGQWNWGLKEAQEFSRFSLTGYDMEIRGSFDTIIPAVSFNYHSDFINMYTANKPGVLISSDSLIDYFVKDGKFFYPINYNESGIDSFEIEIAKSSKDFTGPIVRLLTTFNLTDEFALDFNLLGQNRGTLNFNELIISSVSDIEHERCLNMRKYKNCKIQVGGNFAIGAYSESAINQIVLKGCVIENTNNTDYVIRLKRFVGNLSMTRSIIRNKTEIYKALFIVDAYEGSMIFMTDILFRGNSVLNAMNISHAPTIEIRKMLSIRDCEIAFNNLGYDPSSFTLFSSLDYLPGIIYLYDTDYIYTVEGARMTTILKGGIKGTPFYQFYKTGGLPCTNVAKFNYIELNQ